MSVSDVAETAHRVGAWTRCFTIVYRSHKKLGKRTFFLPSLRRSMIKKLLTKCVSLLPEFAQDKIRERYWRIKSRLLYQTLYQWVGLEHELHTGLTLQVASKGEWWAYNEIFVNGDYDIPIQAALASCSSASLVVLDLGANVGFFAFRVVDLIRRRHLESVVPEITMIEGSPKTFQALERRVQSQPPPTNNFRTIHGLVGLRSGSAHIRESALHVKNTILDIPPGEGADVAFVDLNSVMAARSVIDLLKCDIEGSELLFIENYSDLLRKAKHAVFELHHDQCDTAKCVSLLGDLGFRHKVLQSDTSLSLVHFSRQNAQRLE